MGMYGGWVFFFTKIWWCSYWISIFSVLYNISQLFYSILVIRDLLNSKHYQLYTPPVQKSAWRWPYFWAETCSWNCNLIKVNCSRYRPGVAQRVGTGVALFFHDHGTRRGWVVSSTPRPHFTPGKDQVPILQESGWAPGPVWTGRKSRPHRDFFF